MKYLGTIEHLILPDYRNVKHITWAVIQFDEDKCTGCALCAKACPADSIIMLKKKAHVKPPTGDLQSEAGINQCMGCGDCTALCPTGAISLEKPYRWTRYFKTIGRGELKKPRL